MRSTLTTTSPAAAPIAIERLRPGLALRARVARGRVASWGLTCLLLDSAMLVTAVVATVAGARFSGAETLPPAWTLAFVALALILFQTRGLYAQRLRLDAIDDARALLVGTTIAAMVVLTGRALVEAGTATSASTAVGGAFRLWAFAAVYVVAGRVALYWSQTKARARGEIVSPTLIVGSGSVGQLAARRLIEHRELGLLPVGFVDAEAAAAKAEEGELPIPVVGSTDEIEVLATLYDATQVVVTNSTTLPEQEILRMVDRCRELGIGVAFVPSLHEKMTRSLRIEHVGGLPFVTAYATDPKGWQFRVKYLVDRVLAALALVLLAPVFAAAAAAVYLSMGRPIFFRQRRIGRDGVEFEILKFRSMKLSPIAQALFTLSAGSAPGGVEGEDRRTRVGTFLRKSSIDELPQLINVLKGEMSLVGPRPERPEFVDQFTRTVYRYADRHRVKSGITGWAQVHGLRGKTSIADRAEWDNFYVENFSLWLDFKIVLMTFGAVFSLFKSVE